MARPFIHIRRSPTRFSRLYAAREHLRSVTGIAMGGGLGWRLGLGRQLGRCRHHYQQKQHFNRNTNISGARRTAGSITRSIAAAPRIATRPPRTGLAGRREAIRWPPSGRRRQQVSRQGGNLRSGAVGTTGAAVGRARRSRWPQQSRRPGWPRRARGPGVGGRAGQGNLGIAARGTLAVARARGTLAIVQANFRVRAVVRVRRNLGNRPSQLPSQGGLSGRAERGQQHFRPRSLARRCKRKCLRRRLRRVQWIQRAIQQFPRLVKHAIQQ